MQINRWHTSPPLQRLWRRPLRMFPSQTKAIHMKTIFDKEIDVDYYQGHRSNNRAFPLAWQVQVPDHESYESLKCLCSSPSWLEQKVTSSICNQLTSSQTITEKKWIFLCFFILLYKHVAHSCNSRSDFVSLLIKVTLWTKRNMTNPIP